MRINRSLINGYMTRGWHAYLPNICLKVSCSSIRCCSGHNPDLPQVSHQMVTDVLGVPFSLTDHLHIETGCPKWSFKYISLQYFIASFLISMSHQASWIFLGHSGPSQLGTWVHNKFIVNYDTDCKVIQVGKTEKGKIDLEVKILLFFTLFCLEWRQWYKDGKVAGINNNLQGKTVVPFRTKGRRCKINRCSKRLW